jgi:hypothetical protein
MRFARQESRPIKDRLAQTAALLATVMLVSAPAASANVGEKIIYRCAQGESLSGFSQSAYTQALKDLSADAEEYSDCSSLIRRAQLAAAVGARGGGGSSGVAANSPAGATAVAASPAEQQAVTHAAQVAAAPVQLGGETIAPGVVRTNISSALSSLPTPLLVTLAFLLACMLVLLGGALRKRVRVGRSS